ncbi:hypothetical protein IAD21_03666 [Abditibacteriota bacterium]|nr:hypothetical protein IAD21_03666 [Abditibacteriota bacterium]
MNPLYSLLGTVALVSGKMSRFSINFIPSNWGLMGACALFGFGSLSTYSRDHDVSTLLLGLFLLLVGLLFLLSSLLQHTVFQPQPNSSATFGAPGERFDGSLLFTGKLRLQEKTARRFLAVPAQLVTLENGSPAFASNIDASSRMYGVVTSARRGMWLSIPRPGSLQMEDGLFYHGFKGVPALRLRFTDELDASQNTVIAAFDSPTARDAARAQLSGQSGAQAPLSSPFSS